MCLLLETILIKDNQLQNVFFHNERVNDSRHHLLGADDRWDLNTMIKLPELDVRTIYRCRCIYGHSIENIEVMPYTPRIVKSLFVAELNDVNYAYKYADRRIFEELKKRYPEKPNTDVLIAINGNITDASFANIVFFNGNNWITPDTPLLKGTRRAAYLQKGIIKEARIKLDDLHYFQKARLINALIDLETGSDIYMHNIIVA